MCVCVCVLMIIIIISSLTGQFFVGCLGRMCCLQPQGFFIPYRYQYRVSRQIIHQVHPYHYLLTIHIVPLATRKHVFPDNSEALKTLKKRFLGMACVFQENVISLYLLLMNHSIIYYRAPRSA